MVVADAGLRSQLGPGAGHPVRHQAGTSGWDKLWEKNSTGRSQILEKENNETCLGTEVIVQ